MRASKRYGASASVADPRRRTGVRRWIRSTARRSPTRTLRRGQEALRDRSPRRASLGFALLATRDELLDPRDELLAAELSPWTSENVYWEREVEPPGAKNELLGAKNELLGTKNEPSTVKKQLSTVKKQLIERRNELRDDEIGSEDAATTPEHDATCASEVSPTYQSRQNVPPSAKRSLIPLCDGSGAPARRT